MHGNKIITAPKFYLYKFMFQINLKFTICSFCVVSFPDNKHFTARFLYEHNY